MRQIGEGEEERQLAPQIPARRRGLWHVIDAAGYSLAGLRQLMHEPAARLEVLGLALGLILMALRGASLGQWLIFLGLSALVFITEALNTAIEVLTDRISPEWSPAAKKAKDLGSFAVSLSLIAAGLYLALVVFGLI